MSHAPSFPDEIISEILSPALKVPDENFAYSGSEASPFATYTESSSAYLVVCKAWLRVGTPLLYNVVILRSKAQAKALCETLSDNEELGKFIKKLRVEGGYGAPMRTILQSSPNISDLFLSLEIRASDGTAGLCNGLPSINPTRLILRDAGESHSRYLQNKMLKNLLDALASCCSKWDRLCILDCPYLLRRISNVIDALKKSTTLHTVIIPLATCSDASQIISILKETPLRVIQIRKPLEAHSYTQQEFLKELKERPDLRAMIKYTEEAPKKLQHPFRKENIVQRSEIPSSLPYIAPRLNPSFTPMESASQMVQEGIWKRILYYAMSVPELEDDIHRNPRPRRLSLLLVSKTFNRLALPYYYANVRLNAVTVVKFSDLLKKNPSIGPRVRVIVGPLETAYQTPFDILNILSLTTGLERFHYSDQSFNQDLFTYRLDHSMHREHEYPISQKPVLSWDAFEAMAKSAGSTLREFSQKVEEKQFQVPPTVFKNFKQLRSLDWKCSSEFDCSSETVAHDGLNSLVELRIWYLDPTFLTALKSMELPSLRRLALSDNVSHATSFLHTHGSKLSELDLQYETLRSLTTHIFALCPNLGFVSIFFGNDNERPVVLDFTDYKTVHHHLEKVKFDLQPIYLSVRNARHWDMIFSAFEPAFFPKLREVEVTCCVWPTSEREIVKSHWVRWAERFMKNGVSMVGKDGKKWRARLGRG
ncbi:hypothetical protein C8R44DRAFT_767613 [Mycena epipterygia]|nr:hypothetical protein C8R44DRAFT_767613 [Mycena epipterygia]